MPRSAIARPFHRAGVVDGTGIVAGGGVVAVGMLVVPGSEVVVAAEGDLGPPVARGQPGKNFTTCPIPSPAA